MPNGMTSHDPQVFTSWKEIASYLGKGVRTVQRWEAQFGLPVQRPNIRSKGIVRASREELDQWIATRWSARSVRVAIPLDLGSKQAPQSDTALIVPSRDLMHQLRVENRQLVEDLRKSLQVLNAQCQDLWASLAQSRELRHQLKESEGGRLSAHLRELTPCSARDEGKANKS